VGAARARHHRDARRVGAAHRRAARRGDAGLRGVDASAGCGAGQAPRRDRIDDAAHRTRRRPPEQRADRAEPRRRRLEGGRARRRGARAGARGRAQRGHLMRQARRGRPGRKASPAPLPSRHVEAFLEMLAAERGAAALTLAAYRADLADVARALDGVAIESATSDDLRQYLALLAKAKMAPRTAARRLSALRQFYRFLVLEHVRKDDPTAALDAPRLGRPLPKLVSEDEAKRLLDAAHAKPGPDGLRLVCLLELLYGTGLRVSELVGLPLSATRGDQRFLLVRGKGDKERVVPLGAPARAALAAYIAVRGHFLGEG